MGLLKLVILLVGFVVLKVVECRPQEKVYPLRLQPELDAFNVDKYLKNERLMDYQIKCVLYDGPCDIVGRWVKPRVAAAFLGECLYCTETQKVNVQKIIGWFQEKRPEVYKYAIIKFLRASGIEAPSSTVITEASPPQPLEAATTVEDAATTVEEAATTVESPTE